MKNKKIFVEMLLAMIMLVMGAGVASAGAIGEPYSVQGIQIGWWILGISVAVILIALAGVIDKKKFVTVGIAVFIIGGVLVVPIETTTPPPADIIINYPDDDNECCPFDVTGTAITSGTGYITSTVWDEDTMTLTIPVTVTDASNGNLSKYKAGVNFTFKPMCTGASALDLENIHFSTEYLMKYGGEYMLDEDSTGYIATWTTEDGTEYYDGSVSITAGSSEWARLSYTFVNATAGSWVSELDAIGDSKTWYASLSNDCGDWSTTITFVAIVIAYSA